MTTTCNTCARGWTARSPVADRLGCGDRGRAAPAAQARASWTWQQDSGPAPSRTSAHHFGTFDAKATITRFHKWTITVSRSSPQASRPSRSQAAGSSKERPCRSSSPDLTLRKRQSSPALGAGNACGAFRNVGGCGVGAWWGSGRVEADVVRVGLAVVVVVQAAWRYWLMSPLQVECRRIGRPGRYSTTSRLVRCALPEAAMRVGACCSARRTRRGAVRVVGGSR